MATSGTISSNKKDIEFQVSNGSYAKYTYWLEFRWTAKYKSPGVTTVTWNLHGCRQYKEWASADAREGPYYTSLNLVLAVNNTTSTIRSFNRYDSTGEFFYNRSSVASGSFDVYHNTSNGFGNFTIYFNDLIVRDYNISTDWVFNNNSGTGTLDNNYSYSACSAPTSISVSSSIIKPGGSVTVSWSGAKAGTANPIAKYAIYWKINGAPSTSSYTGQRVVTSNATSGSTSITQDDLKLSSSNRGQSIQFGIVTIGTVSGYNSGIKTGGQTKVNSLPSVPKIKTDTNVIFPSTNANQNLNIEVSAGSDGDGQTCSVYYGESSLNTPNKVSGTSVTLKQPSAGLTKTYYFRTYDGLEYSNATEVVLTVNSKPLISIETAPAYLINENDKYVVSLSQKVTPSQGQNNNLYIYSIYYGNSQDSLTNKKELSLTTNSITIDDIRKNIDLSNSIQYYRIHTVRYDGIEYSDERQSQIYYIKPTPEIQIFNSKDGQVVGFEESFSKYLYVDFGDDEGYKGAKISWQESEGGQQKSIEGVAQNGRVVFDFSNEENHGLKREYTVELLYNDVVPNTQIIKELTRVNKFAITNFIVPYWDKDNPYKPYEKTKAEEFTFTWGVTATTDLEKYGLQDVPNYYIKFGTGKKDQIFEQLSDTQLLSNITNEAFYEFIDSYKNENISETELNSIKLALAVKNVFGEEIINTDSDKDILYMDLKYKLKKENIQPIVYIKKKDGSFVSLENTDFVLKEGIEAYATFTFQSYNSIESLRDSIRLEYGSSVKNNWIAVLKDGANGLELQEGKESKQPNGEYLDIYHYSFISQEFTIFPITNSGEQVRIRLNNCDDGVFKSYDAYYHSIGEVELLDDIKYEEGKVTYTIDSKAWGVDNINDPNITKMVYFMSTQANMPEESELLSDFDFNQTTGTFDLKEMTATALRVRLKIVTQHQYDNDFAPTEKVTYTNYVILYNTVPTLSYRKNRLGINTQEPEGALTVQSYKDNRFVFFKSLDGSISKIDLETGELIGFKYSCGSWD